MSKDNAIEITVPLAIVGHLSFWIERGASAEMIRDEIAEQIALARNRYEKQGEDPITGVYVTIEGPAGDYTVYDPAKGEA